VESFADFGSGVYSLQMQLPLEEIVSLLAELSLAVLMQRRVQELVQIALLLAELSASIQTNRKSHLSLMEPYIVLGL